MDREHRHELKTNELAEWIAHVPDFLQQYGKLLAGAVFLVIAAVAVFFAWRLKSQAAMAQKAAACTAILQSLQVESPLDAKVASLPAEPGKPGSTEALQAAAAQLATTAETISDPHLAVMALIKQADALRATLHYRGVVVSRDQIIQTANQADTLDRQAAEKAAALPDGALLAAMARMGSALCAEELGRTDKAAEVYRQIAADPALAGTVMPVRARLRLKVLPDTQGTYTFPEAPAAPAAEATPGAPNAPGTGGTSPTGPVIDVEQIKSPAQPGGPGNEPGATKPAGESESGTTPESSSTGNPGADAPAMRTPPTQAGDTSGGGDPPK